MSGLSDIDVPAAPPKTNRPFFSDFLSALAFRPPPTDATEWQRTVRLFRFYEAWYWLMALASLAALTAVSVIKWRPSLLWFVVAPLVLAAICWHERRQHAAWLRGYGKARLALGHEELPPGEYRP